MVLLYSLHNNVVVFSQFESTSATKGKQFFAYFCEIIEEFDLVIEKHHYSHLYQLTPEYFPLVHFL